MHFLCGQKTQIIRSILNGRISLRDLKESHVKKFGEKYLNRFEVKLNFRELTDLTTRGISVKSCYGSLIVWRNSFAHEGVLPANASYFEIKRGFDAGKIVLECLAETLVR
jgi:hypothetical protein